MDPIKTTHIKGLWTYLETIDWSDPWLSGLLAFHLVIGFITFVTFRHQTIQAIHFIILLMMVYMAEKLNELGARNWRLFSRQQYFDSNGMFVSVVFSTPLLVNCLIILMSWVLTSSQLMVATGRLKLQHNKREREKLEQQKNK